MSEYQGFKVVRTTDLAVIAKGLRLSAALQMIEKLSREGKGTYRTEEHWEGVPITYIDDPRKKF